MPGMRLTAQQVHRFCGIEKALCKVVLDSLVDAKFLCVKADGAYARLADGAVPSSRPVTGDYRVDTRVVRA